MEIPVFFGAMVHNTLQASAFGNLSTLDTDGSVDAWANERLRLQVIEESQRSGGCRPRESRSETRGSGRKEFGTMYGSRRPHRFRRSRKSIRRASVRRGSACCALSRAPITVNPESGRSGRTQRAVEQARSLRLGSSGSPSEPGPVIPQRVQGVATSRCDLARHEPVSLAPRRGLALHRLCHHGPTSL